jgi:hypothetical protein
MRRIWGSIFVLSVVAILGVVVIFVEGVEGPWGMVFMLGASLFLIPAGVFLVLAVVAAFEFQGAKKR